ncbi:PAS domain S-box protein [Rhodocytophaga aerolata]|uniref:histidine kinase n=1 Tax=Rhodocytophaga aerolata TaxID=455078 RepID=A0ABT8R3W4_9BACT|nr:PAS domain S-box protein [Rhodocytophaga aerolata]MDO1445437.1 PAS domain S-box protein [Rhodocytophaga aerolata]
MTTLQVASSMKELARFAEYVLVHTLDDITAVYLGRAREVQQRLLQAFSHLSDEQILTYLRGNFKELLQSMVDGTAHEHALQAIALWADNKFPFITCDMPGLHDLIEVINIRKYSFIKLLPSYTTDVHTFAAIILELNEYYDFYQEKLFESYISLEQKALRQEKTFIETVLDSTEEGISVVDQQMRITVWNKAIATRTGISKEFVLGKNVWDLFPLNAKGVEYEAVTQALQGQKVHLENIPIKARQGYYDVDVVPLKNAEGAVIGSVSISKDVTEKKLREEKLQAAYTYHLKILEDFPAFIWRSDAEATRDYFNQTWLDFTGKTQEQERNNGWLNGIHPQDKEYYFRTYTEAFENRIPFRLEYRLQRHDGVYRWLMEFGKPIYNLEGEFAGYLGASFDITDQKEAEQKILEEQHFIKTLTDTSPDIISVYDLQERKNVYINKSYAELLGYTQQEVHQQRNAGSKSLADLIHPDDLSKAFSFLQDYRASNENTVKEIEYRVKDAAGKYRWMLARYNVFKQSEEGKVLQIIGISRDITDRKKAEEEILENKRFIQQIAEATPDVIIVLDLLQFKVMYANQQMETILGYTPEQVYQMTDEDRLNIIHPDDTQMRIQFFQAFATIRNQEVRDITYRVKDAQGQWHWIWCKYTVFKRDAAGKPLEAIGIWQDITEKKKTEDELQLAHKNLSEAYHELAATQEELTQTNEELHETNAELEKRVALRTALLEEQKAALHNLFMQVPALIGILRGKEGRVELFNPTFSKWWGGREIVGKPMREAWPELAGQSYFELIEEVMHTGEIVVQSESPLYINRQNNSTLELVYVSFTYAPYLDLNGHIDGVIIYGVDVTEHVASRNQLKQMNEELSRKNQEIAASEEELKGMLENTVELNQELASRENFLSSIIEQTPFSTWIADRQGTRIRANKAYMELVGLAHEKQDDGLYNLLTDPQLMSEPYFPQIQAVFTEGKTCRIETAYTLSGNRQKNIPAEERIHLIVTIFPVKDPDGEVTHAVIQYEDVTLQHKAAEALKASEEQLRLITDALPVLITYVDKDLRYRFNNKAYEDWFGISRHDVYGKSVPEIIGWQAYDKVKESIRRVLNGEKFYFEAQLPYKGAGTRYVSVNYIPHIVAQQVQGYYALVTDISAHKEAQLALERAVAQTNQKNAALQQVNTDLDNFVYTASHDLRSPIANLQGLHAVLSKKLSDKLTQSEAELMDLVGKSVTKLNQTIKDLAEIVKVQKDMDGGSEQIVFAEILEDVGQDLSFLLSSKDVDLQTAFAVPAVPFIRKNLKSILYNLLSNAIKYQSPGRPCQIHIRTYEQEEYIILSVADNGLGISEKGKEKLFGMFKRFHTHVEGTGIGLYIVKRIVENSGGKIEVESKEGEGTTFRVYFKADFTLPPVE